MQTKDAARQSLTCDVFPFGSLKEYKYVVVCALRGGAWLLSRHRARDTWETQGGHIEPGETPLEAAKRELYEESGVRDAALYPVCDYMGCDCLGTANGAVFLADIRRVGALPESEMRQACFFSALPALTYPHATPVLLSRAEALARKMGLLSSPA